MHSHTTLEIHVLSYPVQQECIIHSEPPCADPESFVRGGPTLIRFVLVNEGIEDPNTTKSDSLSARQRSAIVMKFRWRVNNDPTFAGLVAS